MSRREPRKHFAYMRGFVPSPDSICGLRGIEHGRTPNLITVRRLEYVTCRSCLKILQARIDKHRDNKTLRIDYGDFMRGRGNHFASGYWRILQALGYNIEFASDYKSAKWLEKRPFPLTIEIKVADHKLQRLK